MSHCEHVRLLVTSAPRTSSTDCREHHRRHRIRSQTVLHGRRLGMDRCVATSCPKSPWPWLVLRAMAWHLLTACGCRGARNPPRPETTMILGGCWMATLILGCCWLATEILSEP